MRGLIAWAIAALLAAPRAVLAAKYSPGDAAVEWLQRTGAALGDYNRGNAPGIYDAQSRALSAVGLGGSVAVENDGTVQPVPKRRCLDGSENCAGEAYNTAAPPLDPKDLISTKFVDDGGEDRLEASRALVIHTLVETSSGRGLLAAKHMRLLHERGDGATMCKCPNWQHRCIALTAAHIRIRGDDAELELDSDIILLS